MKETEYDEEVSLELTVSIALERNEFKGMVIGKNSFVCSFTMICLIQFQYDALRYFSIFAQKGFGC